MVESTSTNQILEHACRIAQGQPGGTLATTHAEDGTPYVTFVLFHLRRNGEVLFGSAETPQHARNIKATPEASFLVDNREVINTDWQAFDRVVIEGRAAELESSDPDYKELLAELSAKNRMGAYFTERGHLYRIIPRRIVVMRGLQPGRDIVDFDQNEAAGG
jgi:nitroimidazol reductase NimA-like FMN-containing flavoprotein (pyridoxamine 5'-phosphate oxidase superfamily)